MTPSTLLAMVSHGIGVAPLPSLAWPDAGDPLLTVRPLTQPEVRRALHLMWRADRSLTPAAQLCQQMIMEEARTLSADLAL